MVRGKCLGIVLSIFLAGCQLFQPTPPREPDAAASRAALEATLAEKLKTLPGAVATAPLAVEYPEEVLFAKGAVLPLPGGVEVLAPLAAVLHEGEGVHWRGVVRAATGVSAEYDRALAEKRAELLLRYLRGQGVSEERLTLTVEPGAGAPLSVALQPPASAESAAPLKP